MGGSQSPLGAGPGVGGGVGCSHPSARQSPALGNAPVGVGTQTPFPPKALPHDQRVELQYDSKSAAASQLHLAEVRSACLADTHAEQAAAVGS